ncbi:hypothetical protein K1719_027889 [Acacia pycnantha]|nr:hypothetical protein K1719_027889 [Acacia pycnantha]
MMEADAPSDSNPVDSPVLSPPSPEVVPETPLPMQEQDILMAENNNASPKVPSFKDKLLNSDSNPPEEEEPDLILQQGDVAIGLNGSIPTVDFATHVIETLNQRMGLAVVVKLLGRRIGHRYLRTQLQTLWRPSGPIRITDLNDDCFLVRFKEDMDYQHALLNGPWMIFGHYLTTQPWSPSFKPQEHVVNHVIGWIRLPKLPARYYHKAIIRSIGSVFGEVIRVDYNTDSGERGKFARLAVNIDLTKPLISKIQVDGELIFVEYEGLPSICFNCGRYGHLRESCPANTVIAGAPSEAPNAVSPNVGAPAHETLPQESFEFGEWMQVQRRPRRTYDKWGQKGVSPAGSGVATNSRYDVLNEVEAMENSRLASHAPVYGQSSHAPTGFSFQNKKGKETKGTFQADPSTRQKPPNLQGPNPDSIFNSHHYTAQPSTTSLDNNYNSAVLISDPRQAHRHQDLPPISVGPPFKPNLGNDPFIQF